MNIQERTEKFAVRVIKAYTELMKRSYDDAGKVLAKQFLRSGTSIGANCAEAVYAQSRNDMISKYGSFSISRANLEDKFVLLCHLGAVLAGLRSVRFLIGDVCCLYLLRRRSSDITFTHISLIS